MCAAWIPAFAGMTAVAGMTKKVLRGPGVRGDDGFYAFSTSTETARSMGWMHQFQR